MRICLSPFLFIFLLATIPSAAAGAQTAQSGPLRARFSGGTEPHAAASGRTKSPGRRTGKPQAQLEFGLDAPEPYPQLTGGAFGGTTIPESPDPLVAYRWRSARSDDGLQIYTLRPQRAWTRTPAAFENLNSATRKPTRITVTGSGSMAFDFGIESAAWLEFDSPDLAGEVELSISEYNQPAVVNRGPQHPAKTAVPARYGNTYRLELNRELYEGVRFGWIHVRKTSKPWHITAVRLVCQVKPANYLGAFHASDPLLTRIWYSGAYAVKLNLLKDYFGAILMDRGDRISWTGDAHPAQAAALVAFGNWDFIKANLERTARVDNRIPSYSLYWILSLVDDYRYTGDDRGFDQMAPLARKKIARAEMIWENPPIHFYGWDERLGAGFEDPDCRESRTAYRLLAIRASRELAWALKARGRHDKAAEAESAAARMTKALQALPGWDRDAGLHVAAEAVTAGFGDRTRPLWSREFADRASRLSYSPFNQYFVLQAMARVGFYEAALETVRELWGGQLQYGGTCFFEVFRPEWNLIFRPNDPVPNCQAGYTSLCHPWSSGVTKWLSEEILGIRPVSPGFATYEILPHLATALTSVAGTTPTPRGDLSVELNTTQGRMSVTAPPGTRGVIGIPKQGRTIRSVATGGRLVWDGAFHRVEGIAGAHEDGQFVYFSGVEPGRREFAIRYEGTVPRPAK
ncbi:MAG TPA: alpha-L-rhamnosidase C-terminal domain-containing protein, partial [Bryobacteraceae bacterium]|nr:alpha-L-rhamnosidase C-terminal domain-containing protein [Bryobacteraceae bacterium]